MNNLEGKIGKIVLAIVVLGIMAYGIISMGKAEAAELGPNPPTYFKYGSIGGTAVDNEVQITGLIGMRKSWHPADVVVEGVVRERAAAHLLAARQFGDTRILIGASLNGNASAGIVVGADYKDYMIRIGEYKSSQNSCYRRRCSSSSKNHAAVFIGRVWQLDAK